MFTGIVEELGTVMAFDRHGDTARLTVSAATAREGSDLGASVAVNGVCLTVVDRPSDGLIFELVDHYIGAPANDWPAKFIAKKQHDVAEVDARAEEAVRELHQQPGSIAGADVGPLGSPVLEVVELLDGPLGRDAGLAVGAQRSGGSPWSRS